MLRKILAGFVALGMCAAAAAQDMADQDHRTVAGLSGVPLMPGLSEVEEETVVFDKPEGRIVDAVATGALSPDEVMAHYSDALLQYGWTPVLTGVADGLIVTRGIEVLHIRMRAADGGVRVHFSLAPFEPAD